MDEKFLLNVNGKHNNNDDDDDDDDSFITVCIFVQQSI